MNSCNGCGGSCHSCTGCGKTLVLTDGELAVLETFAQTPFLPVARRADDMTPVYLEDDAYPPEQYSLILSCLEKKGLVDIDYHAPLSRFCYDAYRAYPLHGSMALTARGQQVLELAQLQGIEPEE